MISFIKVAMNTHHLSHPLKSHRNCYQKWQPNGILAFALLTILTGGIAGLILLSTAAAKYCRHMKKIKHPSKSDKKILEISKSVMLAHSEKESDASMTNGSGNSLKLKADKQKKAEELAQRGNDLLFYKKDYAEAEKCLLAAADLDDIRSMVLLGQLYKIKEDSARAFEWHMKAAALGDYEAQYFMGLAYEYGDEVTLDLKQAFTWYERSFKNQPRFLAGEAMERMEKVKGLLREKTGN